MLTGTVRSQINQIWNAFWTGGISNPLEVIEQITHPLLTRRLDDLHAPEERRPAPRKRPINNPVFPDGTGHCGRPYRAAAKEAFATCVSGRTPTANQLEFSNHIIDHLTEQGAIDVGRLYEKPDTGLSPQGVEGLFNDEASLHLLDILMDIRNRAAA